MVGYPIQGSGVGGGSGASSFIELSDAPTTYVGQASKYPRVKVGEDGLEFVSGVTTAVAFTELTDAPNSYTGAASKAVVVNSTENGIEFATVGDVNGPASSATNAVARYADTTGNVIKSSIVTIADNGLVTDQNADGYTTIAPHEVTIATSNSAAVSAIQYLYDENGRGIVCTSDTTNKTIALTNTDGNENTTNVAVSTISHSTVIKPTGITVDGYDVYHEGNIPSFATKFTELSDAPTTYVGQSGKAVIVNGTETGLEFGTASGGGTWGSITGTLSAQSDLQAALDLKSDVATNSITYYVYQDAVGTGDGSSYTNAFTTLQSAINAIPENLDSKYSITINVRKGSTDYLGEVATLNRPGIGLITIQPEYYWYANADSNAVAGKIVDADGDFTNVVVGDRVLCVHYTGTIEASSIDDFFYATVSSTGSGYIQTSEATKVPTTGWKYLINQTVFDGNDSSNVILNVDRSTVNLLGIAFVNNSGNNAVVYKNASIGSISNSIYYQTKGILVTNSSKVATSNSLVYLSGLTSIYGLITATENSHITSTCNTYYGSSTSYGYGIYLYDGSSADATYGHFTNMHSALRVTSSNSMASLVSGYITNTVSNGGYGYNILLFTTTCNATVTYSKTTSGGMIADVDIHNMSASTSVATNDEFNFYSVANSAYYKVTKGNLTTTIVNDAIWNAAGDIVVGTGNDAATVLPKGLALQVLRVNSGATALEYATVTVTDKLVAISSNDTTPGYLNGKLVAGNAISLTENGDGGNETLTVAYTGVADHWVSIPNGYTATPASTSTLTMTSDLTGTLKAGMGLKYTISATVYYGMITAITSNLMTIAGAPLSGDVSNLYFTKTGMIQMPILIPGYYEDASTTTVIATKLGQTIRWQQQTSYLVNFQAKTRVADSSSDGKINVRINGSDISTSNTNVGLTLANTSWTPTIVDINTSNYDINYGEEIEVNATKGTGGTALDLSLMLTFVIA